MKLGNNGYLLDIDASEFLREFNHLQSSNVDILARALELSSIPSNNDLLSQAMEINEINADTIMDFWLFYGFIAFMLWLCCLDYINQMNKIAWDFFPIMCDDIRVCWEKLASARY